MFSIAMLEKNRQFISAILLPNISRYRLGYRSGCSLFWKWTSHQSFFNMWLNKFLGWVIKQQILGDDQLYSLPCLQSVKCILCWFVSFLE